MAMRVDVTVNVYDDGVPLIEVGRTESVLPAAPLGPDGTRPPEADVDLIDLVAAALDRLAADAIGTAGDQVQILRGLIGR